jgi:hypothetical protein
VSPRFSARLPWPAPPNALSLLRSELKAVGTDILDFSESNPTKVLPIEGIGDRAALFSLLDDAANIGYEPDPRGLSLARIALAARIGLDPEFIFLSASTSEAYGWLFKLLCDPGDAILVPRPGYPLFDYLAGLESVEIRPYRLEYSHPAGWRIDCDSIEAAVADGRVRALVLINPNNPTGSFIGADERASILGIANRHGLALIADEVFLHFPLEEQLSVLGPRSFAGEDSVLTFVLDGLSKMLGLPQLKLGWIAASGPPAQLAEAMDRLEIIADSYLSVGSPVMNAIPGLLDGAGEFARNLGKRLGANLAELRRNLEMPGSPHRVLRCEGGWTALIESPRYASEEDLARGLLLDEGLWSQPGYFFDMEREAFFSAGLILPPALFGEGMRRYLDFFERLGA